MTNIKNIDDNSILTGDIYRIFIKYVLSSALGMLMVSLYVFFDTIFVGQRLGDIGLASLNISIPIYNILFGLGLLIGAGSSTVMSIAKGMNDKEYVNRAFEHSIILGLLFSLFCTLFGLIFIDNIVNILGASNSNRQYVIDYLTIIFAFSGSFIMQYVLTSIVRNDNSPKKAMFAMGVGGISNIILDYIFIFPLNKGMGGAALATALSSIISVVILSSHFVYRDSDCKFEKLKINYKLTLRIFRVGLSSFITEVSSGLLIFLYNIELLKYYGDIGVSSYSIIANISLMVTAILSGVSQGMQPLISVSKGASNFERIDIVKKLGATLSVIIGCLFLLVGQFFPETLISAFTKETGLIIDITITGINFYFLAFPLIAYNIIMSGYYQAIEHANYSTLISTMRGILLTFILLKVLTFTIGSNGIWLTTPIVEGFTLLTIIIINYINKTEVLVKELY